MESQILQGLITSEDLSWFSQLHVISGTHTHTHRPSSHNSRFHYGAATTLCPQCVCNVCLYWDPQNDIYEWARDHRVHHKYSETDADPHNAVRGFFFAHIGWLMVRKHPDVIEKGKKLELNDLTSDKVVMFQRK